MSRIVLRLAIVTVCAACLVPAMAPAAQWYEGQGVRGGQRPPPLYPYELQPGQAYAVEVAPGTYVIHHPGQGRAYPAPRRVRHAVPRHRPASAATSRPKRTHANRVLIEELRRRDARRAVKKVVKKPVKQAAKRTGHKAGKTASRKPDRIVRTRKIVHDKPLVIVTRRVVEDPPKVITRRHYVDDKPAGIRNVEPRVIHADAEITILGPDRMSIRLVRKPGEPLVVGSAGPRPVAAPEPRPKHIERERTGTRFKPRK